MHIRLVVIKAAVAPLEERHEVMLSSLDTNRIIYPGRINIT